MGAAQICRASRDFFPIFREVLQLGESDLLSAVAPQWVLVEGWMLMKQAKQQRGEAGGSQQVDSNFCSILVDPATKSFFTKLCASGNISVYTLELSNEVSGYILCFMPAF